MPADRSQNGQRLRAHSRWLGDPLRCVVADCLLLLLGLLTSAVCIVDIRGGGRLLLVLGAACLIPGGAILTRLPVPDPLEAASLAIGLGFSIEAAGALAMAWTGWWHPFACAVVLVAVASVMFLLDLRRTIPALRSP